MVSTFKANPIVTIGGTWAAVLGATLFHVRRQKIPFQLKVIQSRIVAQGFLLAGCVSVPCDFSFLFWHAFSSLTFFSIHSNFQGLCALYSFSTIQKAPEKARFVLQDVKTGELEK